MDTALDRLHAARRSAGMPELDDDEGLALGVRLAREPARSSLRSTRQTVRAVLDTNVVISTAVTPGVVALAQWNGALLVTGDSRLPVRAAPP